MKFSKKTAHRIIVSLAMLAPVLYLFGVMVGALAGWNTQELGASYDIPVSSKNINYKQMVDGDFENEDYPFVGTSSLLTTSFVDYGLKVDYGVGNYYFQAFRLSLDLESGHKYCVRLVDSNYSGRLYYTPNLFQEYVTNSVFLCEHEVTAVRFGPYSVEEAYSDVYRSLMVFDLTYMYGFGQEPSYAEFLQDFPNSYYEKATYEGYTIMQYGQPDFSQYLFNQFFPRDNFVERMGVNALSANPIGFAPFGTFLSYLDVNVFHAANSQIALMLYGMVYWALHVIIAELVYHVGVFIPNIIQRVFDWFGQKGLDDD